MNKETLAEKKVSLDQQYQALNSSITQHSESIKEAQAEQFRLQGEYRLIEEQLAMLDKPTESKKEK